MDQSGIVHVKEVTQDSLGDIYGLREDNILCKPLKNGALEKNVPNCCKLFPPSFVIEVWRALPTLTEDMRMPGLNTFKFTFPQQEPSTTPPTTKQIAKAEVTKNNGVMKEEGEDDGEVSDNTSSHHKAMDVNDGSGGDEEGEEDSCSHFSYMSDMEMNDGPENATHAHKDNDVRKDKEETVVPPQDGRLQSNPTSHCVHEPSKRTSNSKATL